MCDLQGEVSISMDTDNVSRVRASVQYSQATPDAPPALTTPPSPHSATKETVDGVTHKANSETEVKETQEMESMLPTTTARPNSQTDNGDVSATQCSETSCASAPHSYSLVDNSSQNQETHLIVDEGHADQEMDVDTNSGNRLVKTLFEEARLSSYVSSVYTVALFLVKSWCC